MNILKKVLHYIKRNHFDEMGEPFLKDKVNIIHWKKEINLGDTISYVIVEWMLKKQDLTLDTSTSKTKRLMAVGSILDLGSYDTTVWGSGLQSFSSVIKVERRAAYQKFDIRAVRGPLTRQALLACGHKCNEVYGDPAVLLPLIYQPNIERKDKKISLILHHSEKLDEPLEFDIKILDVKTKDYKNFVNELTSTSKVISSSLHGIIIAESYGIPAIFLCRRLTTEIIKFYDWYYSTGRYSVRVARSIHEAIMMEPMPLPDLSEMRETLMNSFPYDLWEIK